LLVKAVDEPSESSPLLSHARHAQPDGDFLAELGGEIPPEGKPIGVAWPREAKTMLSNSVFLIVTFFLQYSISFASIFSAGRLGKVELGAVACKLRSFAYKPHAKI
jgi:MATE family multidrug resistance protein